MEELMKDWIKLHEELVNKVITFCKDHNITDATDFQLGADCLEYSIGQGEWTPSTDSSFVLFKKDYGNGKDDEVILYSM